MLCPGVVLLCCCTLQPPNMATLGITPTSLERFWGPYGLQDLGLPQNQMPPEQSSKAEILEGVSLCFSKSLNHMHDFKHKNTPIEVNGAIHVLKCFVDS